jgi:competence protein ComFC
LNLVNIFNSVRNIISSKECLTCQEINLSINNLCPNCWKELRFLEVGSLKKLDFSVYQYNDIISKILKEYKFNEKFYYLNFITNSMEHFLIRNNIQDIDYVIPIPMHKKSLCARKFNQANLIAKSLAKKINANYHANLIVKIRNTREQKNLNEEQRKTNLRGAFKLTSKAMILHNKNILIIDDISTTNSTIKEVRKTLKPLMANKILSLTLAST